MNKYNNRSKNKFEFFFFFFGRFKKEVKIIKNVTIRSEILNIIYCFPYQIIEIKNY